MFNIKGVLKLLGRGIPHHAIGNIPYIELYQTFYFKQLVLKEKHLTNYVSENK